MPYLDANASEPLRPQAREAMLAALAVTGNPASVHAAGRAARRLLEDAREALARRSPRGRHIIARKSGHWIQLDEPTLVVQAIREMLNPGVTDC